MATSLQACTLLHRKLRNAYHHHFDRQGIFFPMCELALRVDLALFPSPFRNHAILRWRDHLKFHRGFIAWMINGWQPMMTEVRPVVPQNAITNLFLLIKSARSLSSIFDVKDLTITTIHCFFRINRQTIIGMLNFRATSPPLPQYFHT